MFTGCKLDYAVLDQIRAAGPVLFAGTIVTVGGLVAGAVTGRTWTPRLSAAQWRGVGAGALVALLISWALKWFVLGN